MGMFLSPQIPCNNYRTPFLEAVFLVIQWMQARQYVQGQVDWNGVGNVQGQVDWTLSCCHQNTRRFLISRMHCRNKVLEEDGGPTKSRL
jgi:hypothetical protein